MTKHTPEPWRVGRQLENRNREITSEPNVWMACTLIADVHAILTGLGGKGDGKANAERIVACVNACAGIPTETLERAAALPHAHHRLADLKERARDAMIAAYQHFGEG